MRVLDVLLADLPPGWQVEHVQIGANWVLSVMASGAERRAGMASAPRFLPDSRSRFHAGANPICEDALQVAALVLSDDRVDAAVGMATLNGLLHPDENALMTLDAADWLVQHGHGKRVAIFGRFPFIADELRPAAAQVWTFERDPQPGEYSAADIPTVLPQADIVAITSSTLINHTLDDILAQIPRDSAVMMLGPSTPLSTRLFPLGIDLLSGVQVRDIEQAVDSVAAGVSFRQMVGLRRVTLCNPLSVSCD